MTLSIASNINALTAQRHASSTELGMGRAIQRLSSGLRINSAADDAAGLAISDRMSSRINGMSQASRNVNDSISLLEVADGAMAKVTDNLQRLRQLAVQAGNGSYNDNDKSSLQDEARQILASISQIGAQTMFNDSTVFSQDTNSLGGDPNKRAVLDGLKSGWLNEAESLIKQYYGLTADGAPLTIDLDGFTDGPLNVLAFVSGNGAGKLNNLKLAVDMADFQPPNLPDGGSAPVFDDRVIAHEMVHAVMARSMNFTSLPQWFIEGTAELIHGADERLAGDIAGSSVAAVVSSVGGGGFSYSGAYAASRYLHAQLKSMGVADGIKGLMQYLTQNQSANLDTALNAVTNGAYANNAAFLADFNANGVNFVNTSMNLTNADTGAIGGADADGGPVRTAKTVLTDIGTRAPPDVLEGFAEIFPEIGGSTAMKQYQLQIGENMNDTMMVSLSAMNASALGLVDLDLKGFSSIAISHLDQALDFVNKQRVNVGAAMSRLDMTATNLGRSVENATASRSRILDTDYASEMATLTRSQILRQASTAMMAQANSMPNIVLSLIK